MAKRRRKLDEALDSFMPGNAQAPAQEPAQEPREAPSEADQEVAQSPAQPVVQPYAQDPAQQVVQVPAQEAAQTELPQRPERKVRLHCWIPERLKNYIADIAEELGVSEAEIVRHMVEFYRRHGPIRAGSFGPEKSN